MLRVSHRSNGIMRSYMLQFRALFFAVVLCGVCLMEVVAQSDGGVPESGNSGGGTGSGSGTGSTSGEFDDSDGGGSSGGADSGSGTGSSSDQDNGSDPEKMRNPHNVSLKIIRKLDGNIVFTLIPGTLPAGNYEVLSDGNMIFEFSLLEYVVGVDRSLVYASYPKAEFESPLDFEILGKNIQVVSETTVFYSDYVSGSPDSEDTTIISYFQENGNTVVVRTLDPCIRGLRASDTLLKLTRTIGGNFVLECSLYPDHLGDFFLSIGGTVKGIFSVTEENKGNVQKLTFASIPEDETTMPLDFEFLGKEVFIQEEGDVLFCGVINLPVEIPVALSHIGMDTEILSDPLFFAELNSVDYPGLLNPDGLGYFRPLHFPFMTHCLLGVVEYRYTQGRNFLVSEELGSMEILKHEGTKLLYSYKTGEYLRMSETLEDCTAIEPGGYYNIQKEAYQTEVLPNLTDVLGFYDLAFKATQMTQLRSSETITLVQTEYWGDAIVRLRDAVTYRNQAVLLALQVIRSSMTVNEDVEFWNDAALRLIDTVDSALILAQETYSLAQ